ncbi:maleylacetoacetate isomerase [Verticiella sediminum]|uniref:Maleylacetoacetate isomerase n=1 Tax=Verticiella sediminum TaxID=1247510 RepID=A0A556A903_9BURK|nr:maleylacetoacetate isomerase [Verticiella sediminum]TSH89366.1 maleylacetoacetate isomerase [Verticiella sediminum]
MKLYGYFRSSAAYRVRIALELKGLSAEHIPVHLVRNGGEQHAAAYASVNPARLVPTLVDDAGHHLVQSMAIVEYLDETHPQPPLLPADALGRARVRALAQTIACDVHPVNNQRVLRYLTETLKVSDDARQAWLHHWMHLGFAAYEAMLAGSDATGRFSHGDTPTLADLCLVPQIYNAQRFQVDLAPYENVRRIGDACLALPAFEKAQPSMQADAE